MNRFLSTLTLSLIATTVLAQQPPLRADTPIETISVSGTGKSSQTPDRFSFTAGVVTVSPTVDEAVNQNNAKVARVVEALKKAGATDQQIRTSNFSVSPQQDYSQNAQGQLPRIVGYQVSNNVVVTRDDVTSAGKLLQVVLNAGVNSTSGLSFDVSDPTKGRDAGMRAAFADAKAKAITLAQAAGRSVGRALSISEGSEAQPPRPVGPVYAMALRAEAVSEVPVQGGSQEVSYTVSVVFELK